MQTRQKRKTFLGKLVVPAITASVLGYFAVQVQSGRYGLDAKAELAIEQGKRQAEYDLLVAEREALEQRVQLLSDGTLERDMIDEQARRALNMSTDREITILR